jgi:trimeric autotransporter adhesin
MTAISRRVLSVCLAAGWLCSLAAAQSVNSSQTLQPSQASAVVPRLVNYSGKAIDAEGKIISGTAGATFAIYGEQSGGAPLWMETQNVTADIRGNYTVQLGATAPEGLPLDVFTSGEARWLGVRVNGGEEQARVLLLSVPYALKAADAQTLGGLPASAFMLAAASNESASTVSQASAKLKPAITPSVSGTGKTDYIPLWTNTTGGLGDSVLFQSGAKIGVNTLTPATALDVNGRVNSSLGFDLGGEPFAFGSYANENVFLGFAGNTTTSGFENVASGYRALHSNTTGSGNTASGYNALVSNTTGSYNIASGESALYGNTTGSNNIAIGSAALVDNSTGSNNVAVGGNALQDNTTGGSNTATGTSALQSDTTGSTNTATGYFALLSNTTGSGNTGAGYQVLHSNTTGGANTASGVQALYANTTGQDNTAFGAETLLGNNGNNNTAIGVDALLSNSTGSNNTAIGVVALLANSAGSNNTAIGYDALRFNTQNNQTAVGYAALHSNTSAGGNVASGYEALYSNTTGPDNTASGYQALFSSINAGGNTASGYQALYSTNAAGGNTGYDNVADGYAALYSNTTGTENTAVGFNACSSNTTGSDVSCFGFNTTAADGLTNATAIGAHAVVSQSNSLVLGGTGDHAVKVGIGTTAPSSILTIGRGAGHPVSDSWETYSSRRWKKNIQTLPDALAKVEQLRGVSYDLKDSGKHEIGVIAEEVGTVVPEVVSYETNGKDAKGVDYSRLTALLIEAVKQQQKQITAQQRQISGLRRKVGLLESSLRTDHEQKTTVIASR